MRFGFVIFALVFAAIATMESGCRMSSERADSAEGSARIVSLVPSVTETLFALGVGRDVVGVSQYCDYPPRVLQLPKVGTFLSPNIEAIIGLRPTIVIGRAMSSNLREIGALGAMGIPTLMIRDDSVQQIEESIERVGDRIGRPREAARVVAQIRRKMESVEQRLETVPVRRVLMVVGHQPLVAVGHGTYLDDLLTLAHASNIADLSTQQWPRLSLEYVIASRPEVILDGQMGTDPSTPVTFWNRYPSIPAVREHHVLGYPEDPTLHAGPRIGQTFEILARRIHPEAF